MAKTKKQHKTKRNAPNGAGLSGIVAANIKQLRASRKLTLATFGEKTHFSASYVSTMENGHRTPTFASLERVARAFKIPPDKFLRKGAVR